MFTAVDLGPACTLFLLLSFCYCDCTCYLISFIFYFLYYYYYFCCCLSLMMQLTHCLGLRALFSSSWLCLAFDGCSLLKQLNFLSVTMFLDLQRAQFFSPWIMFVFSYPGVNYRQNTVKSWGLVLMLMQSWCTVGNPSQ